MRWLEHRVPPPVIALLCAGVMRGVAEGTFTVCVEHGVRLVIALVVAGFGLAFDLSGLYAVWRGKTTVLPWAPHRTRVLVTSGVYRITRNPMYMGLLLVLVAWAIYLASPWSLVGVVLFVLVMNRFQIQPEERVMEGKFGEEFVRYASRVRRWL